MTVRESSWFSILRIFSSQISPIIIDNFPWDERLVKTTGKESVTLRIGRRRGTAVTTALGTLLDTLKERIDELGDFCSSFSPQNCYFEDFFQLVTRFWPRRSWLIKMWMWRLYHGPSLSQYLLDHSRGRVLSRWQRYDQTSADLQYGWSKQKEGNFGRNFWCRSVQTHGGNPPMSILQTNAVTEP